MDFPANKARYLAVVGYPAAAEFRVGKVMLATPQCPICRCLEIEPVYDPIFTFDQWDDVPIIAYCCGNGHAFLPARDHVQRAIES